ncbi:MAG: bifunctional hydroxymethylpyrimidine kinase/phosphomethylpyrimidine kinase [Actinomycetota bacterium]
MPGPEVPRALTVAGSDSGGGAGIQADLKTFQALGVWGTSAVTAVTVQNTKGVEGYEELSPRVVGDQIRAVVTDIGVDAAKTGMLASRPIIEAVAEALSELRVPNLVVDPVFMSKHGHPLLAEDAVEALRTSILPLATLVTPNLPEAAGLAGIPVHDRTEMVEAGRAILALGPPAVLVKGGHLEAGEATDLLVTPRGVQEITAERIDTPHTHGTGCVLSAAITSHLARGAGLEEAVLQGKSFVTAAIRGHLEIGQGIGPVDPSWAIGPRR